MKIYEILDSNELYPKQLLKIKNHPTKLYVAGNINILNNKCIAIVGARQSTLYGEYYAKKFAKEFSKLGITVVSGLAIGIDGVCHQNSINDIGKTIAVIGSGLNNIYPKQHIELAQKIVENGGAIISEYAPNEEVELSRFPIRNRIIAGLSEGVLVIEAKFRSGSSNTATNAFKQGKKVFCIPGRIGDITGVGTNNLIKKGAFLVTNVQEILNELGKDDTYFFNKTKQLQGVKNKENIQEKSNQKNTKIIATKKQCEKERRILNIDKQYEAIYKLLKDNPMEKNEIARKLAISISELNTKLTMMEIEGYIENIPGNCIKIKE